MEKERSYFGRFKLSDIDESVDSNQLEKWRLDVVFDMQNNKSKFDETKDSSYHRMYNLCLFYKSRIELRKKELNQINRLNETFKFKNKRLTPEQYQLMVNVIAELYQGVDLQKVFRIVKNQYK